MELESIGMCSGAVMLLSIPFNFYVMLKKLDAAEVYLQRSPYIVMNKHVFRNFLFGGRHQRLLAIATVILIPRVFQWRRLVLVADVKEIPRSLKYWIVIPSFVFIASVVSMVISGVFLHY